MVGKQTVGSLVIGGVALVAFAGLAVVVMTGSAPLAGLDDGLLAAAVDAGHGWRGALRGWGNVFAPAVLMWVGVVAAVAMLFTRRYPAAIAAAVVAVGGDVLAGWLKDALGRPRPNVNHTAARMHGTSFPSHHALSATVCAGLVVLALWPVLHGWWRWLAAMAATIVAAATAVSRVLLGLHYPTDILGGALLGIALVSVVAAVPATRPPWWPTGRRPG